MNDENGSATADGAGALTPVGSASAATTQSGPEANLADILERVLDKGIVVVGDIRVNLLDIELLTIKLRLLIASVDTARRIGIDWWEHDPWLSGRDGEGEPRSLAARVNRIERELESGREPSWDREADRPADALDARREKSRRGGS